MTSQYHLPLRLRIQPSPLLLLDMLLPFPSNNVFRATIVAQPNRQEKPHFSPKLTDITQLKTPPEKVQKTQKTISFRGKIRLNSICKIFMNEYDFSIYHTLKELEKTAPTNPNFEITLKRNICNGYCALLLKNSPFRQDQA